MRDRKVKYPGKHLKLKGVKYLNILVSKPNSELHTV